MSDGMTGKKNVSLFFGLIFLFLIAGVGMIFANPAYGLAAFAVMMIGVVVAVGVVVMQARQRLPVNAQGQRVVMKSYLLCPECDKRFYASGIGHSAYGHYHRDPERYATSGLRWHLINVHRHERLQAQKEARNAPFLHEEHPV
jgi:hypothetical protein